MAEPDFDEAAWRERVSAFRREKEDYLLRSADSPLADVDHDVASLSWFPLDPSFRVIARYQPARDPESVALSTTKGPDRPYDRVATFGFTVIGDHHVLTGYRATGTETVFVPFSDGTNGERTPSIGRYLDVDPGDADTGDEVVLDFNLAQVPYAAYTSTYASTLPPDENHVRAPIQAGEREPDRA